MRVDIMEDVGTNETRKRKGETMTTTTSSDMIVRARAKAFSTEPMRQYKFSVDANGTVRVWDSVAGHYTTCHSLSERQQARIRKLAAASR